VFFTPHDGTPYFKVVDESGCRFRNAATERSSANCSVWPRWISPRLDPDQSRSHAHMTLGI
jgi:hypothetical protein